MNEDRPVGPIVSAKIIALQRCSDYAFLRYSGLQSQHSGQKWRFSTPIRKVFRKSQSVSNYGHGHY